MSPRDPVTGGGKPSLGSLLRQTRVTRERTQKDLEREVDIDRSRLSAYENDRERPNLATLEKIAAAIGLDLPWEPTTEDTENKKSWSQWAVDLLQRRTAPSCLPNLPVIGVPDAA